MDDRPPLHSPLSHLWPRREMYHASRWLGRHSGPHKYTRREPKFNRPLTLRTTLLISYWPFVETCPFCILFFCSIRTRLVCHAVWHLTRSCGDTSSKAQRFLSRLPFPRPVVHVASCAYYLINGSVIFIACFCEAQMITLVERSQLETRHPEPLRPRRA
jgi:hypothetical protein